jgi:hypothetical protein
MENRTQQFGQGQGGEMNFVGSRLQQKQQGPFAQSCLTSQVDGNLVVGRSNNMSTNMFSNKDTRSSNTFGVMQDNKGHMQSVWLCMVMKLKLMVDFHVSKNLSILTGVIFFCR